MNLVMLKGVYISILKQSSLDSERHHAFCISYDHKHLKPIILYHSDSIVINDWVKALKLNACNLSFDDKYNKLRKLGNGKFSTVF